MPNSYIAFIQVKIIFLITNTIPWESVYSIFSTSMCLWHVTSMFHVYVLNKNVLHSCLYHINNRSNMFFPFCFSYKGNNFTSNREHALDLLHKARKMDEIKWTSSNMKDQEQMCGTPGQSRWCYILE